MLHFVVVPQDLMSRLHLFPELTHLFPENLYFLLKVIIILIFLKLILEVNRMGWWPVLMFELWADKVMNIWVKVTHYLLWQCAEALGTLTFLASDDIGHAVEVMTTLENVFRASYLKGDRSVPSHSPDISALHNAALISWTLLLSIAPDSTVQNFIDR